MAQDLFGYIKDKAVSAIQGVSSFIQQNPTPAGFIQKQVQSRVVQPVQQQIQQNIVEPFQQMQKPQPEVNFQDIFSKILDRTRNTPFSPAGVTYNNASTWKAPLEEITSKIPQQLKLGAPGLQIPEIAGSTVRNYGELAQGKPTVENVAGAALDFLPVMGGLKAVKSASRFPDILPRNTSAPPVVEDALLKGDNSLLETVLRYIRPKGASPINFVADEAGNVSKVKTAPNKLFESARTTTGPSGDVKLLDAPKSAGLLPSAGQATPSNPVTSELMAMKKSVEDAVKAIPKALFPKSTAKKVVDYTLGDSSLRGQRGIIANDSPAGGIITKTIDTAEEKVAQLAGSAQNSLRGALQRLSATELSTLSDVIEGKAQPISQAQAQAATVWKGIAENIYSLATETGMKVGKIQNYFPHFTVKDGMKALDESQFIDRGANMSYGNLTKTRTGAEDYIKDPTVLFDYIDHAYKSIVNESLFGQGDKYLYDLARKTANPSQVTSMLDGILGKGERGGLGEKISSGITNFETTTKMGLMSPFTNLTQQLSTMIRTDTPTALKTYSKIASNPEQAISNAVKAHEIDPTTGMKILQRMQEKGGSTGSKWLELIRFNLAEKSNRIFSVNAGMEYATKLAEQAKTGSQAAIRELQRLGLSATPSEQDIIKAGRKISQETQFATGKGELPQGWETNLGKVLTQFKGFAYKQTGFIKEQAKRIGEEVRNGNFKPLLTALTTVGVAAPIVGEINNDLRSLISNKKREDKGVDRYLNNVLAATSFGLLDNASGLLGQYGEAGVVGSAAGPFASDALKISTGIADANKGIQDYDTGKSFLKNVDPNNTTQRTVLGMIPGVGKTISNTVVPNSYVDNLYGGANNGLNQKDKITYGNMKATDPKQAELFREKKKTVANKEPSFLDKVLGKKQPLTVPDKTATPQEKKDFNFGVDDVLKNGAIPSKEQLNYRFFEGRNPNSSVIEERMKVFKVLGSALDSDYSDEQKQAILEASGVSQAQADYYTAASKDEDVKLQEMGPKIAQLDGDKLLTYLGASRAIIGGKQMLTSGMITQLYDQGVIGKNERDMLNALKFDESTNKFYFSRGFAEGDGAKKLTYAQAKKIFSLKLPDFSSMQRQIGTVGGNLITGIKIRKAKKFILKK